MKLSAYYEAVLQDLRSPEEELLNVITHGVGLLLAIVGVIYLLTTTFSGQVSATHLTGATVFGSSLVAVYLTSTAYHATNRPRQRRIWNTLDHIAIYFLIAGTYTPFILLFVRTTAGHAVLIGLWCIAALGLVYKIFAVKKHKIFSTLLYLGMGWAALFIFKPLVQSTPGPILGWIVAGGVCYTLGAAFYLARKLRYHHAVWHMFVLAGSVCHYFGVLAALSS
jgi:hemolysin III